MAQAAQEKEKGNAAFKAGDYPTAIGHYSAAIHADRTDATFPLNRAAAYLKLGKNEDAERDCSTVLTLSKGNTKALFRRAQARVGLEKLSEAHEDLKEAAKLEPANQSVKQELSKVAELIQKASAAKKSKTVPTDVSLTPKRRRIPITIVETDGRRSTPTPVDAPKAPSTPSTVPKPATKTNAPEASDLMKPVSSRPLNASSSSDTKPSTTAAPPPKPAAQPIPKPSSFKDAKSARDSSKPSRVGGGIFRATGESTIFTREGKQPAPAKQDAAAPTAEQVVKPTPPPAKEAAPSPPPAPVPVPKLSPPVPAQNSVSAIAQKSVASPSANTKSPMTLFDFTRAWEGVSDPAARFALFSQIPPTALPALFQTSLEPALFVEIADTLGARAGTDGDLVAAYMRAFSGVPRFGTVVRLLSRGEKARVREAWGALGVEGNSDGGLPPQLEEVWAPVYR
ncbi:hypothetical protein K438DRAFT_2014989 [Mycena galopus ATCC 62051]|nr:hypothetical protein K438DRAFT_2014989 [Mycena galopus ATCC 62051]